MLSAAWLWDMGTSAYVRTGNVEDPHSSEPESDGKDMHVTSVLVRSSLTDLTLFTLSRQKGDTVAVSSPALKTKSLIISQRLAASSLLCRVLLVP